MEESVDCGCGVVPAGAEGRIGESVTEENGNFVSAAEEMQSSAAGGEESLRRQIAAAFPQKKVDVRTYSPLALAFLGDGVYSLIIRTIVVEKGNRQAEKLHNETRELVSAKAQARIGVAIQDLLTQEERQAYRRGHNASPEHHAKNATMQEYLEATALETLCGWLYLQDRTERFLELLRAGMEACGLL